MSTIEVDTEDFFSDNKSCISGIARVDICEEYTFDADIGGVDGVVVQWANLIDVKVGNTTFSSDQICEIFGGKVVDAFEKAMCELREIGAI